MRGSIWGDMLLCKMRKLECIMGWGDMLLSFVAGFPQRGRNVPTKPRSRSVPDVVVLNSQPRFPAELLIKCQRLPRGFFWNHFFPSAAFLS